jgi:hypothetical protein
MPRCRAIALIVHPWLRSADAFTSFSHVSIAVGSFERSSDLAITSVDGAADVGGTSVGGSLRGGENP